MNRREKNMKTMFKILAAALLAFLAGCANQGEPPRLSTTYGREGDFNSNNSMPSAW
jgi:hypothetical protein